MEQSIKAKWLRALRSGRYKQTQSSLKEDGAYCCLGVLANVQGAKWRECDNTTGVSPFIAGKRADDRDPTSYLLPRFAGDLQKKTQIKLANLNDEGKSFKEIADYIEKHF